MGNIEVKVDHNYHPIESDIKTEWEKTKPKEYWDYRKEWNDNPKNNIVGRFPIHLDIEATSNCNLLCTMCPRTEMVKEGTFWKVKSFDYELYKKIIDEGTEKGLKSIKYNILGEPTLNTKLIDMIRYAKEKGVVDVMFNTNATSLTEKKSKELIESGLDKLFFSFDSPYRDQYNEIRVGADFDKVLNNIKRFHEIRSEMKSVSPLTRISMVRMPQNEQAWQDFYDLFSPIVDHVAWIDYIEHTNTRIEEHFDENNKFCCPQLWQRMFIHPDGVVNICCVDAGGARKIKIGKMDENTTVEELWTSAKYENIRKMHRDGNINNLSICKNCHLALLK